MKISSWNVNSVRARIINITNYLKDSKPDVLMMQEIKTEQKNFPLNDFKNLGYDCHVSGLKSYNDVALLSKINIGKIDTKFFEDKRKEVIEAGRKRRTMEILKEKDFLKYRKEMMKEETALMDEVASNMWRMNP